MGFFNALMTGGTIVGKVCQSLSPIFASPVRLSNGSKLLMSDLVVGGGTFMTSDDNGDHETHTYLFNPTGEYLSLSMPDIGNGAAMEMIVKSSQKLPIDDYLCGNVEPDAEMLVGPISAASGLGDGGVKEPSVKITLKDLKIGGDAVSVGGFTFEAKGGSLFITCGAILILGVTYLFARGNHGVSNEILQLLNATRHGDAGANGGTTYKVSIDFEKLGFKEGEVLKEVRIYMVADGKSLALEERASKSVPLTDAEREYFASVGMIEG